MRSDLLGSLLRTISDQRSMLLFLALVLLIQSRYLPILEMIAGVIFVAILVARLTGVYPLVDKRS